MLDKEFVKRIAMEVNQDAEGVQGSLLKGLMQSHTSTEMVPFFPYFKILFKFVQIAFSKKNLASLERKLITADKSISDLQVKISSEHAIIENLSFHKVISTEAARTSDIDVYELTFKEQELNRKMKDINNLLQGGAFDQMYFSMAN